MVREIGGCGKGKRRSGRALALARWTAVALRLCCVFVVARAAGVARLFFAGKGFCSSSLRLFSLAVVVDRVVLRKGRKGGNGAWCF